MHVGQPPLAEPGEESDGPASPVRLIRQGQAFEMDPPCADVALKFMTVRHGAVADGNHC